MALIGFCRGKHQCQKNEIRPVEQRIKSFAFRLKNDFGEEIRKDLSRFKARVIGTLKAVLPRQRPGRRGNAEIKQAAEIYTTLYVPASSLIAAIRWAAPMVLLGTPLPVVA